MRERERWWNTNIIVCVGIFFFDKLKRKLEKGRVFYRLDRGWDFERIYWMRVQRENERDRLNSYKLEKEGF